MATGIVRRAGAILAAALLSGCGLSLDLDPPDPTGFDAAIPDAGRRDGGRADAGEPPGCVEDGDCDDGDACDGIELCLDGICVPGEPLSCPDDDVCDGGSACVDGECVDTPPPACPADDDPCNGTEICDPVIGCTVIPHRGCGDTIDCTVDTCVVGEGCRSTPDDALCTAAPGGVCDVDSGGCQYPVCDATSCVPTGCVDAHCVSGACVYTALCAADEICCGGACAPAGCDDGNPCTVDRCDPAGCVNDPAPSTTICDDGDRCTIDDRCDGAGACMGGTPRLCADGDPCTLDLCAPATGCSHPAAPDDTACTDGDACTSPDLCSSGICMPGDPRACVAPADRPCVVGSCDPLTGCVFAPRPAGTVCGAGGACDGVGNCCGLDFDCGGDGVCECPEGLSCGAAGGCPGFDCMSDAECGAGQLCCPPSGGGTMLGYCYDRRCPGCCPGSP